MMQGWQKDILHDLFATSARHFILSLKSGKIDPLGSIKNPIIIPLPLAKKIAPDAESGVVFIYGSHYYIPEPKLLK